MLYFSHSKGRSYEFTISLGVSPKESGTYAFFIYRYYCIKLSRKNKRREEEKNTKEMAKRVSPSLVLVSGGTPLKAGKFL